MSKKIRLNLPIGLDHGPQHVRPRGGAQVPGGGRDERFDIELVRRDEQTHERHLIVRLVGDVGQHDDPRFRHVGIDAGGKRGEGRGVGDRGDRLKRRALLADRGGSAARHGHDRQGRIRNPNAHGAHDLGLGWNATCA